VEEDEVELCAMQFEAFEALVVLVYFPAMQSVHQVVPVVVWNFPGGHSVHTEAPVTVWNFPSPHDVHVAFAEEIDPTGPYLPAAHMEPEQAPSPPFLRSLMILLLLFLQKQSLAFAVYLFGIGTLHTGPGLK
jgi:hypothetical protein